MSSPLPIRPRNRAPLDLEGKPLPQSLEAERSVLGAILDHNDQLAIALAAPLSSADFFLDQHKLIFSEMILLAEAQRAIDLITLMDALRVSGRLAAAGGAEYLAQLASGAEPKVAEHARIVKEKSALRRIIHETHRIQQEALAETTSAEEIVEQIGRITVGESKREGLVVCDFRDFISMDITPVEFAISPILPVNGVAMVYSWRGAGKTNFTLNLAYCLSVGIEKCFVWDIPRARPVLYVDGEMDAAGLQERAKELAKGHGVEHLLPAETQFRLITPDLQKRTYPNIASREGQKAIEKFLDRGMVLFLDNLSCLCPSDEENETENWVMVQEWLLHLRRCGVTTVFLHHAGKGGAQRGWSGREDILNLTIGLRVPSNYQREDGLRCEVHLEKIRGKAVGAAVQPFEIQMSTVEGATMWTQSPLRALLDKQAYEMLKTGMKPGDVAQDLRMSRFQIYRLQKKIGDGWQPRDD